MKQSFLLALCCLFSLLALAQGSPEALSDTGISYFPNYHPLIVHFPIILLLVAAAMQLVSLFYNNRLFNRTIVAITVSGFVTGLLAATLLHAEPARNINATAHEMFEEHETFAYLTLWLSGFAAAAKTAGLFFTKKWVELAAAILLLGAAVTVSIAGHHGSALVFKQGVGPEGNKLGEEGH